jgi:hypothetical protein
VIKIIIIQVKLGLKILFFANHFAMFSFSE